MTQIRQSEPINLDHFQEEYFRHAIRRHVQEYHAHFGDRLAAIYVFGSVHRNEAVPGVSDLDLHPFIADTRREADEQWWQRAMKAMDQEFPGLHGLCRPHPVAGLFQAAPPGGSPRPQRYYPPDVEAYGYPPIVQQSFLLRLRYDATLVWGRDLIEGLHIPPPDRHWAEHWFLSPWELVRYAAGSAKQNQTDFDLPEEPPLRLRYFAKLAVYGGAALLMARIEFRSFRGADVIPPLAQAFPQWAPFLEQTRGLYIRPSERAADALPGYLSGLVRWMDWIGEELGLEVGRAA